MRAKTADGKPLKIGKDYWITDNDLHTPKPPQRMMFTDYSDRYNAAINVINQPPNATTPQYTQQSGCNGSPAIATSSPSSCSSSRICFPKITSMNMLKVEEREVEIENRHAISNLQVVGKSRKLILIFRNTCNSVEIECIDTATAEYAFESFEKAHENYLSQLLECSYRTQEIVDKVRTAIIAGPK